MIETTLLPLVPVVAVAFAVGSLFNAANLRSVRRLIFRARQASEFASESNSQAARVSSEPHPIFECREGISVGQPSTIASDVPEKQACVRAKRIDETLEHKTASEHAAALLAWLQSPGGLTGSVTVSELTASHREMCADYGWADRSWISVGRELRRALGQRRTYGNRSGQKVRVYEIPTIVRRADRVPLRRVA
jgi:hypothetical protein